MRQNAKEEELRAALEAAAAEVFEKDNALLDNDVHEISMCHRLAVYLERRLPELGYEHLSVDIEYNRQLHLPKYLKKFMGRKVVCALCGKDDEVCQEKGHLVRPDLVVHERTTHDNNILVVECKKEYTEGEDQEFDLEKIKAFMDFDSGYIYAYGAFLVFHPHEGRHVVHWSVNE